VGKKGQEAQTEGQRNDGASLILWGKIRKDQQDLGKEKKIGVEMGKKQRDYKSS